MRPVLDCKLLKGRQPVSSFHTLHHHLPRALTTYQFHKHLLSTYYVPESALGKLEILLGGAGKVPILWSLCSNRGDSQQGNKLTD